VIGSSLGVIASTVGACKSQYNCTVMAVVLLKNLNHVGEEDTLTLPTFDGELTCQLCRVDVANVNVLLVAGNGW